MRYFFLFLLLANNSFSQKLGFDIFLFGNKIGQSSIEKTIKNDSITSYTLQSNSEAHIFFTTRKISLHYDIVYKNSLLFSSYSEHNRNDERHTTTINRQQNNTYLMKRDAEAFCLKPEIDCSTVKLFFAEPCNTQHIFSERLGEWRPLKKTGEGTYEADMKEGITYYYHYKNGKLMELEMKKGLLGSVYLRPKY
ncbi:MAG: hypothetical protein NTY88_09095 [Bacteroidetes bacterium]|nr:hypothetical protein [Bacteroidota bacterium]